MKKTLNNAMKKKFENMVSPSEETDATIISDDESLDNHGVTPVIDNEATSVIEDEPAPVLSDISSESVSTQKEKTIIPLVPEEKSSGVLHIRLGELRSYVDFITQSTKTSYQQYISSLIKKDYEDHKEIYLKYKEFMDQFHL